jgi:hypothetical protein
MPGPQFPFLAGAADISVIVAYAATPIVVDRPESIIQCFDLAEDELIVFKRAARNRGRHAVIYGGAFGTEPVEQVVGEFAKVSGWSVRYGLGSCDRIRQRHQTNQRPYREEDYDYKLE